jgi:hypothetical protein
MTDINKYKNVTLSKEAYAKLDKIRKLIVPNTIMSKSKTVDILINEKEKSLHGKSASK